MFITLLTPTRNRPIPFALLERQYRRFVWDTPHEWVVVNDGPDDYAYTCGQRVIRRSGGNLHSLCENMLSGLEHAKGDAVVMLEDDDWFSESYPARMVSLLSEVELCGISNELYYYFPSGRLRIFANERAATLSATGFRRSVFPLLSAIAKRGHYILDTPLWGEWQGSKLLLDNRQDGRVLHVGMKGLPGEANLTGWMSKVGSPIPLCELIGSEASWYAS